jgi:hypothetical protein
LRLEDARVNNPKLAAFIEASMAASDKYKDRNEFQYWACLVFHSYDQKIEFLKAMEKLGVPMLYNKYVDGEELAKAVGHPVQPNKFGPVKTSLDKKLESLVLERERERALLQRNVR